MARKTCKMSGCSHRRTKVAGTDEVARYCKSHLCKTNLCAMKKLTCDLHCPTHKCINPECPDSRAPRSLYCKKHFKCGVAGCSVVLGLSRERSLPAYCPNHMCATAGCPGPGIFGGGRCGQCWLYQRQAPRCQRCGRPDTINHYCPVQCCQWPECPKPVLENGRCEQHQPQPCLYEGCKKFADRRTSDGAVYEHCDSHAFCAHDGCKRLKDASKPCCAQCACGRTGCDRPQDRYDNKDNKWCRVHTCRRGGCDAATLNDADEKKFRYCHRHNCTRADCTAEAAGRGTFCKAHTCSSAAGCRDPPVGNGHKFCADHECKEAECLFEARVPGGYCLDAARGGGHACRIPGCREKAGDWAVTNPAFKLLCGNHAIEHATKDVYNQMMNEQRRAEEDDEDEGWGRGHRARPRRNSPRPMPGRWRF